MTLFRQSLWAACQREFKAYFASPLAYVFIIIFLILVTVLTWDLSRFFDTGAADLTPFFYWHPWLYTLFMPALAMRLWADESQSGTFEIVLSLPVSLPGIVVGKFLAAWSIAGISLLLTFPWWVVVNILGPADNPTILLTYCLSFLMAGSYISLGCAISALTKSAVLAFVIGVLLAFVMTVAGWPLMVGILSDTLGVGAGESVALFSFLTHFETAQRGVLEWRGVFFYLGYSGLCLGLAHLFVSQKRNVG